MIKSFYKCPNTFLSHCNCVRGFKSFCILANGRRVASSWKWNSIPLIHRDLWSSERITSAKRISGIEFVLWSTTGCRTESNSRLAICLSRVCCMRVRNSGGIGPSVRLGWLEVRAGHRGLTTTALEFEFFIFMRASVGNQPLSNPSHLLHTTGIYATI